MRFQEVREEVVAVARRMFEEGLVTFTAGNISLRIAGEDAFVITPTSRPYTTMKPEDLPIVNVHGQVVEGEFKPSSETPMHSMIMRMRPDVNAIVHTHSPYATAFAVARKPIPLICVEGLCTNSMAVLPTEYGVPGTEELGERVIEALNQQPGSQAVLIANHGLLTIGKTLAEAYATASKVETEARIYTLALIIGTPVLITDEQVYALKHKYLPKKSQ